MRTIKSRHAVREDFSANSSGAVYYDSKGQAIDAFNATLADYGFYLDPYDCGGWDGDEGRRVVTVRVETDGPFDIPGEDTRVGYAHFTYYRMESGRWEIIGYLA